MGNESKATPNSEALQEFQDFEPDERLACLAYTAHKNGIKYADIASLLEVSTYQAQQLARSGKVILHPETAAWHDGLGTKTWHALRDAGYASRKAIFEGIICGEITDRPTKAQRVRQYGSVGSTSVPGLGRRGYQSLREWLGLGPVAPPVKGHTMPSQLKQLLDQIPQMPQRQDSTRDQLADLHAFANRLGLYDAAAAIKAIVGRQ